MSEWINHLRENYKAITLYVNNYVVTSAGVTALSCSAIWMAHSFLTNSREMTDYLIPAAGLVSALGIVMYAGYHRAVNLKEIGDLESKLKQVELEKRF